MHFLIDSNLPRSLVGLISRAGHEASHVRDRGLGDAADKVIFEHARSNDLALLTRDLDFGDGRMYRVDDTSGIVSLRIPDTLHARAIARLVESFLANDAAAA